MERIICFVDCVNPEIVFTILLLWVSPVDINCWQRT